MRPFSKIRALARKAFAAVLGWIAWSRPIRAGKQSPIGDARHFAVLCVYQKDKRRDLEALIGNLRRAGIYVIVTSTNGVSRKYRGLADAEIVAPRRGRDFTAYKAGFRFLLQQTSVDERSTVAFLNDSVWYFEKYQAALVDRLLASTSSDELFAGTMTIDEVPHVSGWLFAMPFGAGWRGDLEKLFRPHFLSTSRNYHVRWGEHRILPEMQKARGVAVMQPAGANPAVAACYAALAEGSACFYLKADAQLRTNPRFNRLQLFLDRNADRDESVEVLRWLARRSAALYADRNRRNETAAYRQHYFGARPERIPEAADPPQGAAAGMGARSGQLHLRLAEREAEPGTGERAAGQRAAGER